MTTAQTERERIERISQSLHETTGALNGQVCHDRDWQNSLVIEFNDIPVQWMVDTQKTKDLSDFALNDLICVRRVEALKKAKIEIQREIDAIEKIYPCYSTEGDSK